MRFDIMTLFPEMVMNGLETSIDRSCFTGTCKR